MLTATPRALIALLLIVGCNDKTVIPDSAAPTDSGPETDTDTDTGLGSGGGSGGSGSGGSGGSGGESGGHGQTQPF